MTAANKNTEINRQLQILYENATPEFIKLYEKHFSDSSLPRINEFGIIDEDVYDADRGIMVVAKETNNWCNSDYENGYLFRTWLQDFTRKRKLPQERGHDGKKQHITRHPNMWYNLGRWIMYCEQLMDNIGDTCYEKYIDAGTPDILAALGRCAYTNVNKARGGSVSGKAFWAMLNDGGRLAIDLVLKEIAVIRPKVILFCGVDFKQYLDRDDKRVDIYTYHPGARLSREFLLEHIRGQYLAQCK